MKELKGFCLFFSYSPGGGKPQKRSFLSGPGTKKMTFFRQSQLVQLGTFFDYRRTFFLTFSTTPNFFCNIHMHVIKN